MYEPLWEDFYHEANKQGIFIRSIIFADTAWQGQSGLLNQKSLGNDRTINPLIRVELAH